MTRSGPSSRISRSSSVPIVAISTIWSRVWARPVISRSIQTSTYASRRSPDRWPALDLTFAAARGDRHDRSRRQPFDDPTGGAVGAPVAHAVVQAGRPPLPEPGGDDPQPPPTPVRGTRDVDPGEALLDVVDEPFELA